MILSKRLFSVLLAVLTAFSMLSVVPTVVYAATYNDFEYLIDDSYCDDSIAIVTKYVGNDSEVNIPDSIDGYDVYVIDSYAFAGCESLTKVTIPESVRIIENSAFLNCKNLIDVTILNLVTQIKNNAFGYYFDSETNTFEKVNNFNISSYDDSVAEEYAETNGFLFVSLGYINSNSFKEENTMEIQTRTCSVLIEKVTNNDVTVRPINILAAQGGVIFEKESGNSEFSIDEKGRITIPKGTQLGAYKIGVRIIALGNTKYKSKSKTVRVTIRVVRDESQLSNDEFENVEIYEEEENYVVSYDSGACTCSFDSSTETLTVSGNGAMEDYHILDDEDSVANVPWGKVNSLIRFIVIEDGVTYIGNNAFYSSPVKDVKIGGTVTKIGEYAFQGCESLKSVEGGKNVTEIGECAFENCKSLKSIELSNSLTIIPNNCFNYCDNLSEISLPDNLKSIGDHAFFGTGISRLEIPDSVETIGKGSFFHCENLSYIHIGKGLKELGEKAFSDGAHMAMYFESSLSKINVDEDNQFFCAVDNCLYNKSKTELIRYPCYNSEKEITLPSSVKYIKSCAFIGSVNLESIVLPDGLQTIEESAFAFCTGLKSLSLPDSITCLGDRAFMECSSLTEIRIPDGVSVITDTLFSACFSLERIVIGKNVSELGEDSISFWGLENLSEIIINPDNKHFKSLDSVIYSKDMTELVYYPNKKENKSFTIPETVTSIRKRAFYNAENLETVDLPNKLLSIGDYSFEGCINLKTLEIPSTTHSFGVGCFNNCRKLEKVTIPNGIDTIPDYLFSNCVSMIDVVIPESVTNIGDYAFSSTSIKQITVPDSVTSLGSDVFASCRKLTNAVIGNGVKILESTFRECKELESITIGSSVEEIGWNAFQNCSSLSEISFPKSVKTIGNAFEGCSNLSNIEIKNPMISLSNTVFNDTSWYSKQPDGVIYIDSILYCVKGECPSDISVKDGTINIAKSAFEWETELESVSLPDSLKVISNGAFYCTRLDSISIPDNVKSIEGYAFAGSSHIQNAVVGNSVEKIGERAFANCYGLSELTLGNSVKSIGERAFLRCDQLTSVTIPACVTEIGEKAFGYIEDSITDNLVKKEDFVIFSYPDTAAQKYAVENGFVFKNLSEAYDTEPVTDTPVTNPSTPTPVQVSAKSAKKDNPIKVTVKAKTVKLKKLKKKAQKVNTIAVRKAQGKVTYKLIKSGITKKIRKYVKINSKGVLTIKRWKKAKKGIYRIKVKITAKGNAKYHLKTINKVVKVQIK